MTAEQLNQVLPEIVRRLCEALAPTTIYLYGSCAYGKVGPDSDVDLLVVVPESELTFFQRGAVAYRALRRIEVIGSTYFARQAPCPLGQIAAYVNFDMVGRLWEGRLILQAIGSSADWLRLIEMVNIREPLALVI